MKYKKIKPKKIYEEVAEAIYEMIRSGQLKPGDKLDSVQQLAENFQVGRSAIREALTSLRAMGLVDMKQGEGTYIKEFVSEQITFPLSTAILMNKEDIAQLLEVRKIIESGTAAAAAKKRTNQHLAMMESALEEMKKAHGDEELGEKADLQFHFALAEAAQNQLLMSLMNHVSGLMSETMRETRKVWLFSKQTTVERLYDEHKAIYQAIMEQDEEKARYFMLVHLENVEAVLKKYFQHTNLSK
ncbi:FadR/GntR family transcriptional regulator [Neobacillus ginsengisoli]|uniref:GntR family transcriptional repressor for pyruvate dehydrogenase complex n=1 Tax=Neobacillus ginsengisoli TaxID=904295 RepID=A0ABT9XS27_9BACI|nr:FadR/GntR family transcriptional regulator [Neobacillus ginsengisoli]MDQ0198367.1 GntR family transcriptional repressor for pyruvate dehydrogenase complex [Neobacillus ginsengisoli]